MKRFVIACAMGICVWVPSSADAVVVGYNEDAARLLAVPSAVEQSNTQVARVGFPWYSIEPRDDEFNFDEMDRLAALLRDSGIRPIITIFGSTYWAEGGTPAHCACDRKADHQWQEMWQEVALRYPDAILNVWNEPNLPRYGSVGTNRMAELTNEAAAAIWEVDPGREVLGPPASPCCDWQVYAGALYPKLDPRIELAVNLYPVGYHLVGNIRRQLVHARQIAGSRKIWITETNVSLALVSEARQARYVRRFFELAKRQDFEGVIFHRLWSPFTLTDDVNPWDAGLSALAIDGSPLRLYNRIGRLHPGYEGFEPPPPTAGGSGIVVADTPPPFTEEWAVPPCPPN